MVPTPPYRRSNTEDNGSARAALKRRELLGLAAAAAGTTLLVGRPATARAEAHAAPPTVLPPLTGVDDHLLRMQADIRRPLQKPALRALPVGRRRTCVSD